MLAQSPGDKTFRIWDAISATATREVIQLASDGLRLAWRPDGAEALLWPPCEGHLVTSTRRSGFTGREHRWAEDLGGVSQTLTKLFSAKKKREGAHFTSLCYSADGSTIQAGGQSKHIGIYHVDESL